ncbi:nematode fatty acid retinoid binding protein, partial [Oesophagostomum dentatum]
MQPIAVMFRHYIIVSALFFPFVATQKVESAPLELKDLIPRELRDLMGSLSNADRVVLAEIRQNASVYSSEKEVMATLRRKSPILATKVEKYQALIRAKIASLAPEAKAFASEIFDHSGRRAEQSSGIRLTRAQLMRKTLDIVNKYNELSDAAKMDFQQQF